jgi:hypothetical protein
MWSIVSTKDVDRPYKQIGEDLGLRLACRHARGLRLHTWIDSRPFDYNSELHPSPEASRSSCLAAIYLDTATRQLLHSVVRQAKCS